MPPLVVSIDVSEAHSPEDIPLSHTLLLPQHLPSLFSSVTGGSAYSISAPAAVASTSLFLTGSALLSRVCPRVWLWLCLERKKSERDGERDAMSRTARKAATGERRQQQRSRLNFPTRETSLVLFRCL
jgi:hypothetical protein